MASENDGRETVLQSLEISTWEPLRPDHAAQYYQNLQTLRSERGKLRQVLEEVDHAILSLDARQMVEAIQALRTFKSGGDQ